MNRRAWLVSLGMALGGGCITSNDNPPNTPVDTNDDSNPGVGDPDENASGTAAGQEIDPIDVTIFAPEEFPAGGTATVAVMFQNEGDGPESFEVDVEFNGDPLERVSGELAGPGGGNSTRTTERFDVTFDEEGTSVLSVADETAEITVIEPVHDWSGVDPRNTNHNPLSYGPTGDLTASWSAGLDDESIEYIHRPAVVDGTVFAAEFGSNNDLYLRAFDLYTGEEQWGRHLGGYTPEFGAYDAVSRIVVDDDQLYVVGNDLYVLSTSGEPLWEFDLDTSYSGGLHDNAPLVLSDRVIAYSAGDGIYALEKGDGEEIWWADDAFADSRPAADDERVYCIGREGNEVGADIYIKALDRETGEVRWEYDTEIDEYEFADRQHSFHSAVSFTPPLINEGRVHIGTAHYDGNSAPADGGPNHHLIVLDRESGDEIGVVPSKDDYNELHTFTSRLLGIQAPLVTYGGGINVLTNEGMLGFWAPGVDRLFGVEGIGRPITDGGGFVGDVVSVANADYIVGNESVTMSSRIASAREELDLDTSFGRIRGGVVADGLLVITGREGLVVFSD